MNKFVSINITCYCLEREMMVRIIRDMISMPKSVDIDWEDDSISYEDERIELFTTCSPNKTSYKFCEGYTNNFNIGIILTDSIENARTWINQILDSLNEVNAVYQIEFGISDENGDITQEEFKILHPEIAKLRNTE